MTRSPTPRSALASTRALAAQLIDECLNPPAPGALRAYADAEHVLATFTGFSQAFPDARLDVEWIVADADCVAIGGRISATHGGPWRSVTATGRRVVFAMTLMLELDGGKVTDVRTVVDTLAVAEQIGAVEALGPPACRLVPHGAPQSRSTNDPEGTT